ncbi:MAG: glycoside hydrolase family 2 protein [Sphaerochaetaceae bacterium]
MRNTQQFNDNWIFIKEPVDTEQAYQSQGEAVYLPHTWNNKDGQDGGNDYYRGRCHYVKHFAKPQMQTGDEVYLEFRGVNSSADVMVNGSHLCHHDGGYSSFRVRITEILDGENVVTVAVDNSPNRTVYPQKADFTFYGGIYRDVYLIVVSSEHFLLEDFASPGVKVTPTVSGKDAVLLLEAMVCGNADEVVFTVQGVGEVSAPVKNGQASTSLSIPDVRLWNGVYDPYQYTLTAQLRVHDTFTDEVSLHFGCRSFRMDPEHGFFLNGKAYPLRGVSRHQDYWGVGNAITREMMEEDMAIIREMGANTIRLAHYQHDQYFYDLCDEAGIIVWAEIPYISEHMEEANANAESQLKELILQNVHHPSIVCWGLSNEITAVGGCTDAIIRQHKKLQALAKQLDTTRPTTMADVFMLPISSPLLDVPDINSYNLYYGWYLGALISNDEFFDTFHETYPQKVIGFSEYGADANPQFQSNNPERGDYTEQYQTVYHEHLLRMIEKRPYLWATHVWNMFDFGADGRDEGGAHGLNQKGLVTIDRKVRKDAYYLYKAHWSTEPFVHICGRRYVQRTEAMTQVKVYANTPDVSLYVDGKLVESQQGEHLFLFEVPLTGQHTIEACSQHVSDTIQISKVDTPNPNYQMAAGTVTNWFDQEELEYPDGYFSIRDSMLDIKKTPQGVAAIASIMEMVKSKRGDVAKGVHMPAEMQRMIDATPLRTMLKQAGESVTPEMVLELNKKLNKIKKTE